MDFGPHEPCFDSRPEGSGSIASECARPPSSCRNSPSVAPVRPIVVEASWNAQTSGPSCWFLPRRRDSFHCFRESL